MGRGFTSRRSYLSRQSDEQIELWTFEARHARGQFAAMDPGYRYGWLASLLVERQLRETPGQQQLDLTS